jgi:hypothetical protein
MNTLKHIFLPILMSVMPVFTNGQQKMTENASKTRVIITCGPGLDDLNSLIRLLLFSSDFRIEGLIYAGSQYHWRGDGHGARWYVPNREYSGGEGFADMGLQESWRWANVLLTMLLKSMKKCIPI